MRTKLTAGQVDALRSRHAAGGATQQDLADEFGVSQGLVSKILRGEVWAGNPFCQVCGTEFEREHPRQRYCSEACFAERRRARSNAAYRMRNPLPEGLARRPFVKPEREDVSYSGAHMRLRKHRGSATSYVCAECGAPATQWAYNHADPDECYQDGVGAYSMDPAHYSPMCVPCHKRADLKRLRQQLG